MKKFILKQNKDLKKGDIVSWDVKFGETTVSENASLYKISKVQDYSDDRFLSFDFSNIKAGGSFYKEYLLRKNHRVLLSQTEKKENNHPLTKIFI